MTKKYTHMGPITIGEDVDLSDTHLIGFLYADEVTLVNIFGPSLEASWDRKVQTHWAVICPNGAVAHIYDYKDDRTPWHVGGTSNGLAALTGLKELGFDVKPS